ncbi:hypothetical protein U1Q18_003371 [Sarracenia purpurea var. burkii]
MNNMVIKNSNLRGSSGMQKQANEGEIAVAQSGDSSAASQPTEENEVETWAVEKEGRNDGGETDQVEKGEEENTEIDDAEDDGSVEIKFDKDQNKAVEVDMKTDGERKLQTVVNKMSTGSAHKVLVQMPKQNFDSEMSETTTVEDREVVSSNAREDVGENEEGSEGFLLEAPGEGGDCRKTGSEPYGNKVRSSVNDGKLLEINLSSDGEYCADGVLCEAPILANMKIPTDPMEDKKSNRASPLGAKVQSACSIGTLPSFSEEEPFSKSVVTIKVPRPNEGKPDISVPECKGGSDLVMIEPSIEDKVVNISPLETKVKQIKKGKKVSGRVDSSPTGQTLVRDDLKEGEGESSYLDSVPGGPTEGGVSSPYLLTIESVEGRVLDPYLAVSSDLKMTEVSECKLDGGSGETKDDVIGEDESKDSGSATETSSVETKSEDDELCQTVFGKGSFATALPRSWVQVAASRGDQRAISGGVRV